jgi:hypothetical protein
MKKNVFVFSLVSLVCLSSLTLLNSCLKQNDNTQQQPSSLVSILQASPGAAGMDLYFNQDKITTQPLPYTGNGSNPFPAGNYKISFVNSTSGDTLVQHRDSIEAGQFYSVIVYDTASKMKLMFFKDQFNFSQDQSSMYLRFLQLSPDAGPVDVYVGTTKTYSQRTFADNVIDPTRGVFAPLAQDNYSFTAVSSSTGDTLGQLSNIGLSAGRAYTLFLRGLASHTQDSLGLRLSIMLNYQ